ncbi:MAG: DUF362 domain-containing protein [Chloroflexi bacterium]|nr:DUF362 domain-containing protein [Chloroflexota bacterium]MBU1747470.1 DUF362 domain-containing protein [Chloroflexota bacterium]MBU1877957.1 DUF362 domain-containing protein [Chloroflexota bacterium]
MSESLTRREFLARLLALGLGSTLLPACSRGPAPSPIVRPPATSLPTGTPAPASTVTRPTPGAPVPAGAADLAVVHGSDPAAITRTAIDALGGMKRFVSPGADVVIKPNICVDYHTYEYAATTNPWVVAALVTMCREAGAARVRVMDMPFGGTARRAYDISGIADAVREAGGEMEVMTQVKFVDTSVPDGRDITRWNVYDDVLKADLVINVPIAKHHNLARLSLAGKNLMGVITQPARFHANLGQRVADLMSLVRPGLTVVDAVRILTRNGPTGGSLNDVVQKDTVIASADMVAADAYAAGLFDVPPERITYIKAAVDMGLGTMAWQTLKVAETSI